MNDMTPMAKQPRAKKAILSIVNRGDPPAAPAASVCLMPSAPQPVALRLLRRAPENVRHTRIDEDVAGLADDIAAHGLLSSLIGYDGAWPEDTGRVFIVGGGRRLQALQVLMDRGIVDGEFTVPVLIRAVDEAIELSLSENLQQRTMSPVDEFFAFKALMENPANSTNGLAKRFGFSERVVKQRLRLAELAPEILDALACREITLDAAMAYASSQDQRLQSEIFKVQKKKPWEPHKPRDVKYAIAMKGISTADPLFVFAGAAEYERRGGGYEDDLFNEDGGERRVVNPGLLQETVRELIEFQMVGRMRELRERADLAPTIVGHVVAADLKIKSYGNVGEKPPAGTIQVEKWESAAMWRTIRNNGIDVHVLVGVDEKGELAVWPRIVFVPKSRKDAVAPAPQQPGYVEETPEQRAAGARRRGVDMWARRLGAGSFAGTPFEGRAFWPDGDRSRAVVHNGENGWMVGVDIFVSDAAIAAAKPAAEARYEEALAKREAEDAAADAAQARADDLRAMEPPAIVVIDGFPWARQDDGSYAPLGEDEDGFLPSWLAVLANHEVDDIGAVFETLEAFDAAMAAATQSDEPEA